MTGLTNGTAYTFTVIATNAVGNSVASTASMAVTPVAPNTVPGAPTGVVATAGNASASVAFVAPASNGGTTITGYTVTSNPGGITATGATSPINMTGLTNGTAYTFTVIATNAVGNSVASTASMAVTPVTVPTVSTTVISSITGTGASSGGNVTYDGGASVTVRGVVWGTSGGPTVALSTKTTDGTGTGSFTSTLASLNGSTTYYVRAYATNSVGTAYGNEVSFTTSAAFSCGTSTVSDIDGNPYTTVSINTQCWMIENMKTSHYLNGDLIPIVTDNSAWGILTTGGRTWYNNDSSTYENPYGNLYNWYAVTDSRGLCPTGWHVPTDSDWNKLVIFLDTGADTSSTSSTQSSTAGGKLKSMGTVYWQNQSIGTDNSSGFSALPGGYRLANGSFSNIRTNVFFWSFTAYAHNMNKAWYRNIYDNNGEVRRDTRDKIAGASVRCLRD